MFAIYGSELATAHLSFEPRTRDEVRDPLSRARTSARTEPHLLGHRPRHAGTEVESGDPHGTVITAND
ncbi:hypothetical protein [Streptomyces acidiscabies]|uniref:Uncharacterized protein n=1 Tax=Streptomyces acidiscabies TaxID=42234 RepID=A0A0L0KBK2_9ACTN|nr:hypothetical protein [Streptomyces acidiscabies]KND35193.1 hypothetical protein IQ63_14990 [Streptomyces acidiscabies]